jgi:UDP-glucose:tetrahydrobiopterin glucosyltransferase
LRLALVAPLVTPIREPNVGGSQAFVADLARGLAQRGHSVHLYAASGSHVNGVDVVDVGVDHRELEATLYRAGAPEPRDSAAAARAFGAVYAEVADGRYDVLHNHAFDAPAITLAARAGAAIVHTLHLPPERAVAAALGLAQRDDAPPAVACVSESQAQLWRAHVTVDAVLAPLIPTRLIPFAVTAPRRALFAGRLSPEKGAAPAIDIARAAELEIDVFGDPYDARYVSAQIDPRRSLGGVTIRGAVPRPMLWEAMTRASVVLCPARWEEPFGMVAAEAQACGTPVVAFARGALREVVVDGVTGLLVAPDDIGAAAQAVRESQSLARADCRRHAELELDLERAVDAHERLYARLATTRLSAAVGG